MALPVGRYQRRPDVLVQRAADTTVLLDLERGEYYALDDVGARVWELCDGTRDLREVLSLLFREYEAPPDTIEADVRELLAELVHEKLVLQVAGNATPAPGTA